MPLVAAAACKSGDGAGPTETQETGYRIVASSTTLTVPAGSSAHVALDISRLGGFGGVVELTVDPTPAGVGGIIAPFVHPDGGPQSQTLLIMVEPAHPPRTIAVTVRGRSRVWPTGPSR